MYKDGHVHTCFCPHGTNDSLEGYIEKALSLGFQELSFTEHAPLPKGFSDPTPAKDSSMRLSDLEFYFEEISRVKAAYKGKIKINTGLEVDFIEGFEQETKNFLNRFGKHLDDSILSVHFLKHGTDYVCLDYSPDTFAKMILQFKGIEKIYQKYFQTLLRSIQYDLGPYKPKRMGHITLVKKFQKKFPIEREFSEEMFEVLTVIQKKGYEIDYNGAGLNKPFCKEPYPPDWVAKEALKRNIPLVYGSDAHQIKDLGQGRESMLFCK